MVPSGEPLLPGSAKSGRFCCKAVSITLSLATVICLAGVLSIPRRLTAPAEPILPSDVCAHSPSPTSCLALVSNASDHATTRSNRPSQVFHALIHRAFDQLDAAANAAADVRLRTINDPKQQYSAVADCLLLMDLSRDRLAAAAGGSREDARTWMSAVLTNHATCLDALDGPAVSALRVQMESLKAHTSALLAVLNALPPPTGAAGATGGYDDDELTMPVVEFPPWVPHRDRKLLEASSVEGIQANAVVAKDGSGRFRTVQEAVDSAPDGGKSRYVIYVRKGVYKEQVNVGKKKTNVMIVGDGMDATVITGSLNVVDGATTFNSATLAAVADGLILQDLKIENTAGPQKHQAVALRVGADRAVINRCRLDGYQDTLYAHSLRQFYRDCSVSGTVDFIFGNAAVVLQNCKLIARRPMDKQQNLVTAQGREDPNQNTGTSIQNCQVVPASDLVPVKKTFPSYLGRPWKAYSRTVFMQSFIDDHVDPKGWLEWDGEFGLRTLFYGEYQNRGPGAGTGGRVKWPGYQVITDPSVAKGFTVAGLIQGGSWLKPTGVDFTEGL